MRFRSTMRAIRNMQESTESTPSNPYCPQPGQEPPWVQHARKYIAPSKLNSVAGDTPTREYETDENHIQILDANRKPIWHKPSLRRIVIWAATVWNPEPLPANFDLGSVNLDPTWQGWCAAFLGSMLEETGFTHTGSNIATTYRNWGQDCWKKEHPPNAGPTQNLPTNPPLGAIAVFGRSDYHDPEDPSQKYLGGHVGFVISDAQGNFRILGGNQSSRVCIGDLGWYYKNRTFLGYRWPSDCPCPNAADESSESDGQSPE